MKLTHYFEVSAFNGYELNAPDSLALAITMFHSANTMQPFAVAFPDMKSNLTGTKLRVFSNSMEHLHALCKFAKSRGLEESLEIGKILEVPEYTVVEYFKHLRPKLENQKYRPGKKPSEDYFEQQYKLLKTMPYLKLSSKSGGVKFRLYVARIDSLDASMSEGEPNSFGLSSTRNMVAIPVF